MLDLHCKFQGKNPGRLSSDTMLWGKAVKFETCALALSNLSKKFGILC